LVNNAGIYPLHSLLDMADDDWDSVVDASLRSTYLCTQLAARQMIADEVAGAIVNIASIEAQNPAPLHSHYNAAKAAVVMFTKSVANELGPQGIRVNVVSPGLIWAEGIETNWADGVERWQKSAALTRLGQPDDVADACLFFASPAARWITGAELVVDGGVMTKQIF
jgi:NAD(P)-dependent dehydrogenase (short-subunit alcohol dehydrogenase family)